MSEQGNTLAKLSKSQKKKKSAQKKKLAQKNAKAAEALAAIETSERERNEADARIIERLHDKAMCTRDFQMLSIRGKLLVHPSKSFLKALTGLRQDMCRDVYPSRIHHAQRLFHFRNSIALSPWLSTMGVRPNNEATMIKRLFEGKADDTSGDHRVYQGDAVEPGGESHPRPVRGWLSFGALGLMVWYPVFSVCMDTGDKLACIALRDTCRVLRAFYGMFRNDITKLEQLVFDAQNPASIKQLDWVARRVEVPPSPPQTPPYQFSLGPDTSHSDCLARDPFRAPIVVTKRWADYDDDESLGSPMSLPITPESLGEFDVPVLDLNGDRGQAKESPRRGPSTVVAIPMLTDTTHWFNAKKIVLPVSRLSLFTFDGFPRAHSSSSCRRIKLQSSAVKYIPGPSGNVRVRALLEHWVCEDAEKNLRARLSLGLSGAAKKQHDAQAEPVVFNRTAALGEVYCVEARYMGEPDILGAGFGLSIEDVRDVVVGRFRREKEGIESSPSMTSSEYWSKDANATRIVIVPGADGWICRHLDELQQ